ncbi:MAG: MmcQ/YjbR family DNA-binding protein [Gemmatimonadaceae bacterium]|nr:MmcQ/YjbR family DNA-binding protein [Gemmatimonadaceae bacterium]
MTPRPVRRGVPGFAALAATLRAEGGIDAPSAGGRARAFGADALKVGGKIFAMAVQGTLVLKLPAARVTALVAEGRGTRFGPGHGRVMREWIALDGAEDEWLALAREARAFVGG